MRMIASVLGLCLVAGPAAAATFSYVGTALSPSAQGGTGGTAVTFAFSAAAAPKPGKCVRTLRLLKYADGARTLATLRKAGFQIVHGGDTGPVTFATLCLGTDGVTISGVYEITLTRTVYPYTETYFITNGTPGRTDALDYYVYTGAVPSITADMSASPGSWTITP